MEKQLKKQPRRIVFNEEQLEELVANPILATAIIMAFKQSPDMTTTELIRFAKLSLKQLKIFDEAVMTGELVEPKTIADHENNQKVFQRIVKVKEGAVSSAV